MSGGVGTSEVDQTGPSASALKTYKLNIHTVQFCTEDLVIRSEDFPDVSPGDVLEFYHEEETFSRLLLQVSQESLYPENKLSKPVPKDTVYILKTIAESFHLSNFKSLVVNKVQKENVGLDSVELVKCSIIFCTLPFLWGHSFKSYCFVICSCVYKYIWFNPTLFKK